MTSILKPVFYGLHPKYERYTEKYETYTVGEFNEGVKKAKYKVRIYRNMETGDEVTVKFEKKKTWIEWEDGTETCKYFDRRA